MKLSVWSRPEPCMRCGKRHYQQRDARQCAVETLHSAMRYAVKAHYNRDLNCVGLPLRFVWDSKADEEAALLLELFWQSRRDELNAMQMR